MRLERQAIQQPGARDAALAELISLPPDLWSASTKIHLQLAVLAPIRAARRADAIAWSTGEIIREIQGALARAREDAQRQVELRDFGRDAPARQWPMLSDRKQRIAALRRLRTAASRLTRWTVELEDLLELELFAAVRRLAPRDAILWPDAPHKFRWKIAGDTTLRSLPAEFFAAVGRAAEGLHREVVTANKSSNVEQPRAGASELAVLQRLHAAADKLTLETQQLDYQTQFELFKAARRALPRFGKSKKETRSSASRQRSRKTTKRSPLATFSAVFESGAGELLEVLENAPVEKESRSDEVLMGFAHRMGDLYFKYTNRRPARAVSGVDGQPVGRFFAFLRAVTPSWLGGHTVSEHVVRTVGDPWKK